MARILIVDDESSIQNALRQLFEYEGHQVTMAGDGPEALEAFEEFRPDVMFHWATRSLTQRSFPC